VQQIFASNTGTRLLSATPQAEGGLYTSATIDDRTHELIVRVINTTANARPAEIQTNATVASATAKVIILQSTDLNAENSFEHPSAVAPVSSTAPVQSGTLSVQLAPYSVNVYRIPLSAAR
jgi:alpha-L-arabinofuranosidase